ncbi:MAG: transglycosylase domain-containing protein [Allosphingosinicella sp.]
MRRKWIWTGAKVAAAGILIIAATALAYGADGYFDARRDARRLGPRADGLMAQGRGGEGLGPGRLEQLLLVEDPGFEAHSGVDFSTPGAGLTSLTQSLGKRVGFASFRPGVRKIRLIGYALGLERSLTKAQIVALYLDTVEMGRGPNGRMVGFYEASRHIYGRPPHLLTEAEFLALVAVPIAPRMFDLQKPNEALRTRRARIQRLIGGQCRPTGLRDVWLEGCASPSAQPFQPR